VSEEFARTAGAEIIPAKLFFELFIAVNDANTAFHAGFGRESFPPLAHRFEKNGSSS